MAAVGFTPISLYYSATAAAVPTAGNLVAGELALNTADGKLYYKSSAGVVTLLAGATAGPAGGSNTQVQFNSSGALAGSANLTWNGTALAVTGALSASSTVTLSGGTANGVLYLNGSKVATSSGTALAFDGTNLAIGIAPSSGVQLYVYAPASTDAQVRIAVPTGTQATYISYVNNTVTKVGTENSVGGALASGSSAYASIISNNGAYPVQIGTNNVIRLTVDSAGNAGLGVTPSAWSGVKAFQLTNGSSSIGIYGAGGNEFGAVSNTYYNGTNWIYSTSTTSARYAISSGQHQWYNAPSGTAGNAITFTQAMTLDASGRLGIGATNPSSYTTNPTALVIASSTATSYSATAIQAAPITTLYGGGGSGNATGVRLSQGGSFELFFGGVQEAGGAGAFVFQGYNGSAYAERARIDSSGNLGLGVTPSTTTFSGSRMLQLGSVGNVLQGVTSAYYAMNQGAFFNSAGNWESTGSGYKITQYAQADGVHIFYTAPVTTVGGTVTYTRAVDIDSSGRLLVGASSVGFGTNLKFLALAASGDGTGTYTNITYGGSGGSVYSDLGEARITGGYSTNNGYLVGFRTKFSIGSSTSVHGIYNIYGYTASAGADVVETGSYFRIEAGGIITFPQYGAGSATFSAAGVISSVSDATWKIKDGVPVDPDSMLKKLEPGYWYYNEEKRKVYGEERQLGFYAQNVNAAIGPEAAPPPEEGRPWGYYDRSVLAVAVMSLQKALDTIESLTNRLTALEQK